MLARLSRQGSQWLSLHVERCLSPQGDGESFVSAPVTASRNLSLFNLQSVDLNLASLISPPDLSWNHIARCIVPVYKRLRDTVEGDIEHVSKLLSELEPLEANERKTELAIEESHAEQTEPSRCLSYHPNPSDSPSTPVIIINQCPDEARETSSWVPCQDALFGMRLTVPTHAALNKTHPPLIPESITTTRIEHWQYANGHWQAIAPLPEEQCRRGLYSRPAGARARSRGRWRVERKNFLSRNKQLSF